MIEGGIKSLELTKKTTNDYVYIETTKRLKEKIRISSDPRKKNDVEVKTLF